jgi:anti-sigma regulatory factor (Ser/Thr protein kinase)
MAPERDQHERQRTVGSVPHDALVPVDRRVKEILARREAGLQQRGFSLSLPPVPSACRVARAAVRDRFTDTLSRHAIADLEIVVSELVSNAVEHGCGTIRLDVAHDGYDLHGFVTDGGDGFDYEPRRAVTDGPRGRGLPIVDALVTRWGIRAGRTHVWFDIPSNRSRVQEHSGRDCSLRMDESVSAG